MEALAESSTFSIYAVLLLIGLWAMMAKTNLVKKVIGMTIFSSAIILFYVSVGAKSGATIPIFPAHHPEAPQAIDPAMYANPLPHVLMLTAIVVGVSTFGVALSLIQRIHGVYGTIEEDEILAKLQRPGDAPERETAGP